MNGSDQMHSARDTDPTDRGAPSLKGSPVVPGIGFGAVVSPAPRPALPTGDEVLPEAAREAEAARFSAAVQAVADRLTRRAERATGDAAQVIRATAGLAADRGLAAGITGRIKNGVPASRAVAETAEQFRTMFLAAGKLMAERVTDLLDVRDRLVAELDGLPEPGLGDITEASVILAEDLAPAETAGLDPELVVALATEQGGPTSHTAIIARQLGLPYVSGVAGLLTALAADAPATALVDGTQGLVELAPEPADARRRAAEDRARREKIATWKGPGHTSDGHPVAVLANVQDGAGARRAAQGVAEGVGLFRTEFCFLDRDVEPSVEEQTDIYREVFDAFPGRKVVLRTLDAGSDKPIAYLDMAPEANPALGIRGLRTATVHPEALDRQLDAIAAAAQAAHADAWVMAPMVATVEEATGFAAKVRARGLKPGVMVEIPAAALHAERLLRVVDFVSIGTNDLTQYTMAADRLSPELSALTSPWQPALLQLVGIVGAAGQKTGKTVGVCGEAAADALLGPVLAGLGVTYLSAAAPALPGVGAALGAVTMAQCREAAEAAVAAPDARAAHAAARKILQG